MKKRILVLLAAVMLLTLAAPVAGAAEIPAYYTDSAVLVNGTQISVEAYNIYDNNYFKLRDLAMAITGTAKQFQVNWLADSGEVAMLSGQAYTPVGGELAGGDGNDKFAMRSTSGITLDGQSITLTAYMVNDNNYFKLRDLGQLLDFEVSWDGLNNSVIINTAEAYTGEDSTTIPAAGRPAGGASLPTVTTVNAVYYTAFPEVPDFGASYQIPQRFEPQTETVEYGECCLYTYNMAEIPADAYDAYSALLTACGFELVGSDSAHQWYLNPEGRFVAVVTLDYDHTQVLAVVVRTQRLSDAERADFVAGLGL